MARVSKEPEERKAEIIDAAVELFMTRGFEETSVSDIVKKVGVAQGLFYYYFNSKNDVLEAIIARFENMFISKIAWAADNSDLNAARKIEEILNEMLYFSYENENIVSFVHREENTVLHQKIAVRIIEKIIPQLIRIIEQGIRENLFKIRFPRETAKVLLYGLGLYVHDNQEELFKNADLFNQQLDAIEDILNRILNIGDGAIRVARKKSCLSSGDIHV